MSKCAASLTLRESSCLNRLGLRAAAGLPISPVARTIWNHRTMLLSAPNRAAMSRKSKWIEVDSPEEPAWAVARRAVRARLETVWGWFPDAAEADAENEASVESVHQLRVSTRRASAALRLFAAMLPEKRRKWFEKRLKRARRTAGIARDLDVLAARVQDACEGDHSAGCAALSERVAAARREAQPAIRELYLEMEDSKFEKRVKKLVRRIRPRSDDTARKAGCDLWRKRFSRPLRPTSSAFWRCTNFASRAKDCGTPWKFSPRRLARHSVSNFIH